MQIASIPEIKSALNIALAPLNDVIYTSPGTQYTDTISDMDTRTASLLHHAIIEDYRSALKQNQQDLEKAKSKPLATQLTIGTDCLEREKNVAFMPQFQRLSELYLRLRNIVKQALKPHYGDTEQDAKFLQLYKDQFTKRVSESGLDPRKLSIGLGKKPSHLVAA